ncbi:uncharacterized protein STEHIDRAFT_48353, partial [Stereum hirsutum FP-91666 SS1]|uniref:uncharacterized protein n=1 Tax=Stereum hirsutum (strain FP-91666) TaxID=721885 RepID=UPI000440FC73
FKWIKGHSGSIGNDGADKLAGKGAEKDEIDQIDLSVDPKWDLSGADLGAMTQALAYRAYMERAKVQARPKTTVMLNTIRAALKEIMRRSPSDALIWKALWHKDFTRKERDFFFFIVHGTYKIGAYWNNIPTMNHRAICQKCGVTEDMEHILVNCDTPGQKEVWRLTELFWRQKLPSRWIKPSIGSIAGCALIHFSDQEGKSKPGADRLYRMLIAMSARLIWKLRCERVIRTEEDHSVREIQNRWRKEVDVRLRMDRAMTHPRFEKQALSTNAVLRTWSRTIMNEENLPDSG